MRIVKLTQESKKTLLNDLLKRSPNNYGQYEKVVLYMSWHINLIKTILQQQISR